MTAGESHGPALLAAIEGLPSGLHVTTEDLRRGLACRCLSCGHGARQKFGADEVSTLAGMRHGVTIGTSVATRIGDSEWPRWETAIGANPVDPSGLLIDAGTGDEHEIVRNRPLARPQPDHTDLPGMLSYDLSDAHPVLKHTSARETATRIVFGVLAEALFGQIAGVRLVSHVVSIGAQHTTASLTPTPTGEAALCEASIRILDPEDSARSGAAVDAAKQTGNTVGGTVEVITYDVPVGLGTYMTTCERLDARLVVVLMSIQSVKGVEIRNGFMQAALLGSAAHNGTMRNEDDHLARTSNHAGGIGGGTSNGASIVTHAAFKPISVVPYTLRSIDLVTGEEAVGLHQRSDTCQVVPGAVIAKAEVTLVLTDALSDHAGGRSVSEVYRNPEVYPAMVDGRA